MKNRIWACFVALAVANLMVLFYVYGYSTAGDDKVSAQKISRLISTYAEPESNPVFLVRSEDRCRFYGEVYCPEAKAQRESVAGSFSAPIKLTAKPGTENTYADYLDARTRLTKVTQDYVTFLDTNPSTLVYLSASVSFEEQAGELIGAIVSNLYALQDVALQDADHSGNWAFAFGYLVNLLMIVLAVVGSRSPTRKRS